MLQYVQKQNEVVMSFEVSVLLKKIIKNGLSIYWKRLAEHLIIQVKAVDRLVEDPIDLANRHTFAASDISDSRSLANRVSKILK